MNIYWQDVYDNLRTSCCPLVNKHNYGKSPCSMGKSTISMAMFNSKLLVYQRLYSHSPAFIHCWCLFSHENLYEPFWIPSDFLPRGTSWEASRTRGVATDLANGAGGGEALSDAQGKYILHGKYTGKPHIEQKNPWFPVDFPINPLVFYISIAGIGKCPTTSGFWTSPSAICLGVSSPVGWCEFHWGHRNQALK